MLLFYKSATYIVNELKYNDILYIHHIHKVISIKNINVFERNLSDHILYNTIIRYILNKNLYKDKNVVFR